LYRYLAASLLVLFLLFNGVAFSEPIAAAVSGQEKKMLDGSFFQPYLVVNWKDADFSAEYQIMKEVEMSHIIWQWTIDSKSKQAYYPTNITGFSRASSNDLVGSSLQEAKKANIKVWLGLNWNSDWFGHYANNEKWLTNEVSLSKIVVHELWQQYGEDYADTIAGFYIPLEIDNVNFRKGKNQKRLAMACKEITETIHVTTAKPVMIAPFFNENRGQSAVQYADMWGKILEEAPIDVIALQDGIGCDHASVSTIAKWLETLNIKIKAVRPATELWSDLETFTPELTSAPIGRIISQINAERKYVTNFTSFSFTHYDSPNNGQAERFGQYREYVRSVH
jgi:hypothetical protein